MSNLITPIEASQSEMDPRMREPRFARPKYTRSAKSLEYAQIKDLEDQTRRAEGTAEKHRQEVLEANSFWLNGR